MDLLIRNAWALGLGYILSVGACYVFGYWGRFGVNVLEFVGLSDVAKLAVFPLLASLSLFALGMLAQTLATSRSLPPGGGADTPIGRYGFRNSRILLAACAILIILSTMILGEPYKWYVVIVLLIPFGVPLTHHDDIIKLMPNRGVRAFICNALIILPAVSFALGRTDAYFALNGISVLAVDVQRSGLDMRSYRDQPLIYLGLLGS